MKKSLLSYLIIFLVCSCSLCKNENYLSETTLFINDNHNEKIRIDSEEYSDLYYEIKLPSGYISKKSKIDSFFSNSFQYKNDEKIFLVYFPMRRKKINIQKDKYDKNEFIEMIDKNELNYLFEDDNFIKNRNFKIIDFHNGFFAFYINVKDSQIEYFNNSISTIKFNN